LPIYLLRDLGGPKIVSSGFMAFARLGDTVNTVSRKEKQMDKGFHAAKSLLNLRLLELLPILLLEPFHHSSLEFLDPAFDSTFKE